MPSENDPSTALPPEPVQKDANELPEKQIVLARQGSSRTLAALIADDEPIDKELTEIRKELVAIREELPRLVVDAQVLADLHRQHQALAERFYEREVLAPIFLQLIGIADRCRQSEAALENHLSKAMEEGRSLRTRYLDLLLEARRADRVEIENILANFGVEPFETPEEKFSSNLQTCVTRESTKFPHLVGKIAKRLRPGYRRNGQVVRPECVAVYVASPSGT